MTMKILFRTIFAVSLPVALTFSGAAAEPDNKTEATFKDSKEKASYGIGLYFGTQLKRFPLAVDLDTVNAAIKDVLDGKPPKLTDVQAREAIAAYQAEKNKKPGEEFLAANKKKPDVKIKEVDLGNGKTAELQYKVIKEGTGEIPKPTDTVRVNYRGTFIDGKEFDSNTKHGPDPAEFQVRGVVKGWTEALQMMKVGSKWEIYLPSELAYGDQGNRGIEPGSALIFEMELVGIKPPAEPLTSDIIRVPSAEELKRGDKIQVLKPEEVEKLKKEAEKQEKEKKP
jgi:FKBP-type peptidyl-prolyl cis-trans isomerase FklB